MKFLIFVTTVTIIFARTIDNDCTTVCDKIASSIEPSRVIGTLKAEFKLRGHPILKTFFALFFPPSGEGMFTFGREARLANLTTGMTLGLRAWFGRTLRFGTVDSLRF
jgi:hypothetical protein